MPSKTNVLDAYDDAEVYLYGSRARGDHLKGSAYDILDKRLDDIETFQDHIAAYLDNQNHS